MKSTTKSDEPIISNDYVTCYADRLVIHLYYFPYGNKTIHYRDIQSCDLLPMNDLSIWKKKIWGMALSAIWWHSDIRRHNRESYILLDANQWPKIGLTMDDNQIIDVYKFIKQHMNTNQSTITSSEKKPFDHNEKLNTNTNGSTSKETNIYTK